MKTLKKAKQKNFKIENYFYNEIDLEMMVNSGELFKIELDNWGDVDDGNYRIDIEDVKEIKVILDEDGFYRTVAIGKNDKIYHVEL